MRWQAPDWFPDWTGRTVAIVASGLSALDEPLDPLRIAGVPTIAVNTSYVIAPFAAMLYACDCRWWQTYAGAIGFAGLKVSQDPACQLVPWGIRRIWCNHASDQIEMGRIGHIGWAGNSGFQAINIAAQAGAARIVLIGFDMANAKRWHIDHGIGHPTPKQADINRHRAATDAAFFTLLDYGIEAVLTSRRSALKNYPIMPLREAIA